MGCTRWILTLVGFALASGVTPRDASGQRLPLKADHTDAVPSVRAMPRHGAIHIDGRFDEPAWAEARPITTFRQTQPDEGARATQYTEIRILYDETSLYIGAHMRDSLGAGGVRSRLVRRDQQLDLDNGNLSDLTSDKLTVTLDPFHDHLTRAVFEINPAGVIGDALGAGGSILDPSWDPIWEAAARVDSDGWSAEIRISLSQLRFSASADPQTWGLQIMRTIDRLNERDVWSFAPKSENTGPASYGHLTGLVLAQRPRELEILPYVSGTTQGYAGYRGDPLNHVLTLTTTGSSTTPRWPHGTIRCSPTCATSSRASTRRRSRSIRVRASPLRRP